MFPGPNPYGMLKVLRYARQNGFNILHSHGYKGNVAFGLMPKRLRKIAMVSTLHGWTSMSGLSKNRVYEWLDLISLKHVDAVVLVNSAMLSNPRLKSINGVNYYVVNNGIPTPDEQCNDSTNQLLDENIIDFCQGGYTIGSIGRLSPEKGYRYLIEAFSLLVKKGVDACLIIIGEGYERNFLETLVTESGLSDKVILPGYRNNAENYLPYFNLFALSSLTEGLPITLLEAMQEKVPIVATKVGGIPEVLQNGKGGLLVEPENAENLAEAIASIYNNPDHAEELASISYQKAVTKYSSKTMGLGYLDIYEKLVKCDRTGTQEQPIST